MLNGKIVYVTDGQRNKIGLLGRIETTLRVYRMVFFLTCFLLSALFFGVMIGEANGARSAFGRMSLQMDTLALDVRRYNVIRFADDLVYRQGFKQLSLQDSILDAKIWQLSRRVEVLEKKK
jgi:hypothetical protein